MSTPRSSCRVSRLSRLAGTTAILAAIAPALAQPDSRCVASLHSELWPQDGERVEGFGGAITVAGNLVVVGSGELHTSRYGPWSHVSIYERDGAELTLRFEHRTGSDFARGSLGTSVATNGFWVAAGAPKARITLSKTGTVQLYKQASDGTWAWAQSLESPQTAHSHGFGSAVAMDSETLIVGAQFEGEQEEGAVYVYRLASDEPARWELASQLEHPTSADYAQFGATAAFQGNQLAIGAADGVHIYARPNSDEDWHLTVTLPTQTDTWGIGPSVAFMDEYLFIGVPDYGPGDTGAVFIYENVASNWIATDVLHPTPDSTVAAFGADISAVNGRLLVGSGLEYSSANSAWLYESIDGAWRLSSRIENPSLNHLSQFGIGVAIAPDAMFIGAPDWIGPGDMRGIVSTFDLTCTCAADWNDNGLFNTADFVAYINDYVAVWNDQPWQINDPDLAQPFGVLNSADFVEFLNAFNLGCP